MLCVYVSVLRRQNYTCKVLGSHSYRDKDIIFLKSASFKCYIKGREKNDMNSKRMHSKADYRRLLSPEGKQCIKTSGAYTGPGHQDAVRTCLIQIFFGTTKSNVIFKTLFKKIFFL